jgi:predicted nucleic acid-binding protein
MIVVADASPICYLILIGEIELLPKLFDRVFVPQAVVAELRAEGAPRSVRDWASHPAAWVSVLSLSTASAAGVETLQAGEREAISLAEALGADLILLDEKSARQVASRRGLRVTGVLGVLAEAASRGLLNLPGALGRLTRTSFRYSPALLKEVLHRFSERGDG